MLRTWQVKDNKYREQERKRRRDNAVRRAESAAAAEAGMTIDAWRRNQKED